MWLDHNLVLKSFVVLSVEGAIVGAAEEGFKYHSPDTPKSLSSIKVPMHLSR